MTRPSLIPGGVTVEGELTGKGDLVILGRVLGDINIDGLLIIEEAGAVRGQVRASSVVVRGALAGDAIGQESVRVEATAQVVGDLRAPRVKVADGARVKGRVQIGAEAGLGAHRPAVHAVTSASASAPAAARAGVAATKPAVSSVPVAAAAVTGPRVRRARVVSAQAATATATGAAAAPVQAAAASAPPVAARQAPPPALRSAAVRPPMTMPRLTRVAAARR
jgi:cytoskeletal protein CcmA (bactofilin family)